MPAQAFAGAWARHRCSRARPCACLRASAAKPIDRWRSLWSRSGLRRNTAFAVTCDRIGSSAAPQAKYGRCWVGGPALSFGVPVLTPSKVRALHRIAIVPAGKIYGSTTRGLLKAWLYILMTSGRTVRCGSRLGDRQLGIKRDYRRTQAKNPQFFSP